MIDEDKKESGTHQLKNEARNKGYRPAFKDELHSTYCSLYRINLPHQVNDHSAGETPRD